MEQTHFGFETVPATAKAERVRAVFDSVAVKYDLMNDRATPTVEALCVGPTGLVCHTDINRQRV